VRVQFGMYVNVSPDLEPLLEKLAAEIRIPLSDPMAEEVIVVPSPDMAAYLKRELGRRLGDGLQENGVLANVRFVYPRELVNSTISEPTGVSDSPWDATRLTWTISSFVDSPSSTDLPRNFDVSPLAASRRTAELFDRYASHRPEMLAKWAEGHAYELANEPTKLWQLELYRRATQHITQSGSPDRGIADLLGFREALASHDLPERISVFGVDSLSAAVRHLLECLAERIKVNCYWVYATADKYPSCVDGTRRKDFGQSTASHPLAARWAANAHESIAVMPGSRHPLPPTSRSLSLLHRVQTSIITDTWPAVSAVDDALRADLLKSGDGSIQIHACYGLSRQVEALRDSVLHLLNADETLRLRDILIVCSDVRTAAPVLNAIFDPEVTAGNGVPALPINVLRDADQRLDDFCEAFLAILDLATGRCSASQLVDSVALDPIRRKFGFDDESVELLESWTSQLGVKYGLSATDRIMWSLDSSIRNGTWDAAIERLMMGIAIPAEREVRGPADVVPFDGIATNELLIAGVLVEFLVRLGKLVKSLRNAAGEERKVSITEWSDLLLCIVDNFLEASHDEAEDLVLLKRSIHRMNIDAAKAGAATDLIFSVRDLRKMTSEYLGKGTSDYWSVFEAITVTSFGQMSHVPFRVIAFLGADEAAFAAPRADGDDVLSIEPRVGEPIYSLRGRQHLLDLMMAARSTFILTCTGSDINSNKDVPFAVPVQELLEFLTALIVDDGVPVGTHNILVRHPRHNFDELSMTLGFAIQDIPYTFDENALLALEVLRKATEPTSDNEVERDILEPTRDAMGVTASDPTPVRDISQILDLLFDPISYYFEDILNVDIPKLPGDNKQADRDNTIKGDGVLQLTLDALERSSEGRRLLEIIARHDDHADPNWLDAIIAQWQEIRPLTGLLPPGKLGELTLEEISRELKSIIELLPDHLRTLQGTDVDCTVPLGATVATLRVQSVVQTDNVNDFARVRYSRFAESMRLQLWAEVALLALHTSGQVVTGYVAARAVDSTKTAPEGDVITIRGKDNSERLTNARRACEAIYTLHSIAAERPVAFFPSASRALADGKKYQANARLKKDAERSAAIAWHLDGKELPDLRHTPAASEDIRRVRGEDAVDNVSEVDLFAKFVWQVFEETSVSERTEKAKQMAEPKTEEVSNG